MDGQVAVLVVLLSAILNSAEAQNRPSYFEVGGKLLLRPDPVCGHISSIVWKHGSDLVAEWTDQFEDFDYYRTFYHRTSLNSDTGELEIRNMTKADRGLYTVEINNVVQLYGYDAVVIHKVFVQCGKTSRSCLLSCDTEEPGPVTFDWKKEDGGRDQGDQIMTVTNNEDMQTVPTFSCQMKNPVGEAESEPQLPEVGLPLWILVLGVVTRVLEILALVVVVIYLVWLNRKIASQCKCGKDNAM